MDVELILYIIFIGILFLTRLLKGRNEINAPAHPQESHSEEVNRHPHRRPTFEELLREFTGEGQIEEPVREKKVRQSYEKEAETFDDSEARDVYQRSVRQAKKIKTLDEQVDLEAPIQKLRHFDSSEADEENEVAADIAQTLRDEEGVRSAIILSEILNRKY